MIVEDRANHEVENKIHMDILFSTSWFALKNAFVSTIWDWTESYLDGLINQAAMKASSTSRQRSDYVESIFIQIISTYTCLKCNTRSIYKIRALMTLRKNVILGKLNKNAYTLKGSAWLAEHNEVNWKTFSEKYLKIWYCVQLFFNLKRLQ